MSLEEQVTTLATAGRAIPKNPFGRAPETNRVTYADMQVREGNLLAVLEVYDQKLGLHAELFEGQQDSGTIETDDCLGRIDITYLNTYADKLAGLYAIQEPKRTYFYKGEEVAFDSPQAAIVERLEGVYEEGGVNETLRLSDVYAVLCGNCAIQSYYDSKRKRVIFNLYPSPYVRVAENTEDPSMPEGVVLWGCDYERASTDGFARAEVVSTANAWRMDGDSVQFARFRGERINGGWQRLAALDRIPVTHVFDAKPEPRTGYYIPSRGMLLCSQTMVLNNDYLATLGQACIMQGFSVMVVKGLRGDAKLVVGPSRPIRFDDPDSDLDQDVYFAQPSAPIAEMLDTIRGLIAEVERSHGIPAAALSVESDASGAAIIQANGPLAEIRNMRKPLFRPVETQLLRNTLAVLNAFEEGFDCGDPDDWRVYVDYERANASASVQETVTLDQHLVSIGALSPAEIAMREKPGAFATLEEAQAYVAANLGLKRPAGGEEIEISDEGAEEDTGEDDEENKKTVDNSSTE